MHAFRERPSFERLFGWAVALVAALYVFLGLLGSFVLPFQIWDSLVYGEWSRLIASAGFFHLHFPGIGALQYQRPLFYVLQGWLWHLTPFSERSGRFLSFLFFLLLVGTVAKLAAKHSRLDGQVATLIVLSITPVSLYLGAGLTDIPVAAMVALVGLTVRSELRYRWPAVALAAAGAGLTKTASYTGLLGLLLAVVIVGAQTRDAFRKRVLGLAAPIVLGAGGALLYDESQSRYLHMSLAAFLRAGTSDAYYSALSDHVRLHVLGGFKWLAGGAMILLLLYALIYGVARTIGVEHKTAATGALGLAFALSLIGPAATSQSGPLHSVGSSAIFVALIALLLFGRTARAAAVAAPRGHTAFVTIWALPTVSLWLLEAPYDTRLFAPAWPPLVVLIAWSLTPALRAAIQQRRSVALVGAAAVVALAIGNARDADGLTPAALRLLANRPVTTIFNEGKVRAILEPEFTQTLSVTHRLLGRRGRLWASDGRYRFFYPGRSWQDYPRRCEDLRGYRAFVLDLSPAAATYMRDYLHVSSDPRYWSACRKPRLRLVLRTPDHAVFAVGEA